LALEEIRVVAILPEAIDPFPHKLLARYAAESNRAIIVDEGHDGFNWATGVASFLYEALWGRLEAPIRFVSSDRALIPTSYNQEAEMLVSKDKIEAAILEVISWD
jgi:pyruvate/2-oxoglutarate/acetoin dehydrogenase E1 component